MGVISVDSFGCSAWAQKDFSENYLEKADIYIIERRKMIGMVSSLFTYFYGGRTGTRVLDLGCGDGILTEELFKKDRSICPVLVDGSSSMLRKAEERLKRHPEARFINSSFHALLAGVEELGTFDLCISSHAIHHLEMKEKAAIFKYVAGHLGSGGRFVNADVVLSPSEELDGWYFRIWKDWMQEMFSRSVRDPGGTAETPEDVISRYKDPSSMNRPDSLADQLSALREAGFVDVDCYFKIGIFVVFGGKKA